jgi:hypothetical protein
VVGAAPGGFAHRPGLTAVDHGAVSHATSAVGTYEIFAGSEDLGPMLLGSDQSAAFTETGDAGVWMTSGTSIAFSITSSSTGAVGCTFSGTVGKKGLNSVKKPGSYVCPGNNVVVPWYAKRLAT